MMNSTFLNSPCNAGPIKFDCVGITFTPAGLADCSFSCLRPSSSVRLRRRSYKIRASDAEYETAVVAGNMPEATQDERGIMCEPCGGRGWLVCDFCKGQKTNVNTENRRIYRRCPSCRAVGYILCSKCKVFKCVTFPDASDGVDLVL
ncbi:uncharacterized protein [Coffea arabica]|uniref:Uncharacterized protein n=1 Tax=Coffea arabica TaxID=13443 RepID=A0A6P6U1Y8_COFAR